jgi:hypothetical protein
LTNYTKEILIFDKMVPAPRYTNTKFNVAKGKAEEKRARSRTRVKKSERELRSARAALARAEADVEEGKKAFKADDILVEYSALADELNLDVSSKMALRMIERRCDGQLTVGTKDVSKLGAGIVAFFAMSRGGTIAELHRNGFRGSDFIVSNTVNKLVSLGILFIEHDRYEVEAGLSFFFSNKVEGGDDDDEEMDE